MLTSTVIAFIAITQLEATIIIIGNAFTIFVFWTRTPHLKRTYFILINLAVADLLVGITAPIVLWTESIPSELTQIPRNPSIAFQLLASSTSIFFLALISLERAFAVLWPIRYRATNTGAYIYSIAIVWAVGFCMFGLCMLSMYHTKVEWKYVAVPINSSLLISLLVICASYLKIRTRLRLPAPGELDSHSRQSTERNLRLSRTLFLVTAASLVFWLPSVVLYATRDFCPLCYPQDVLWFVNALHLANSMVNPFVYSYRMAIFKEALKKLFRRRRQIHIVTTPVQAIRLGMSSFTLKWQDAGANFSGEGISVGTLNEN